MIQKKPKPWLRLLLLLALGLLASGPSQAQPSFDGLAFEVLANGLASPVAVTHAGDERLFITLRDGLIVIWDGERLLPQPFLDLRSQVLVGAEQGLLATAFHPDFADNGLFFVDYTDLAGDTVLGRYRVSPSDPDRADPESGVVLLTIPQPAAGHNGGQIQFSPDGYLYVGTGDGSCCDDPLCSAQRDDTLLGKLLRLDVDQSPDQPPYFGIPEDNPFVGPGDPPDEIWAKGLRNPWRFSFDRETGDLYIADVGEISREEVSFQPAGSSGGENYGWKMKEGNLCRDSSEGCPAPLPGCDSPAYTDPILDYSRGEVSGCAVVGGYVYRGSALPDLQGIYFYSDFCSGIVRAASRVSGDWISLDLAPRVPTVTSFGEGADGELYAVTLNGSLLRLVRAPGQPPEPPGTCVEGAENLCLGGGRFRVEVTWEGSEGGADAGRARHLTEDSGTFWFFDPDNIEVLVKVLDACEPFGRFWVFAAGLTDVGVELTVTDTERRLLKRYENPVGKAFQPLQDTDGFATCP